MSGMLLTLFSHILFILFGPMLFGTIDQESPPPQLYRPLRRSGTEMEVAGARETPNAYWSENKAPTAQLISAGAIRLLPHHSSCIFLVGNAMKP
jgi:hypothetical protein